MLETILGGITGGIFRIVPEAFKFLDSKNERKHELAMQEYALKFEQLRGSQRLAEITAESQGAFNEEAINALKESIAGQERPSGIKWIDGLSRLIRPLITLQWVIILYPAVIAFTFYQSVIEGIPVLTALNTAFGPAEKALVAGILNFWFLGRVWDKVK